MADSAQPLPSSLSGTSDSSLICRIQRVDDEPIVSKMEMLSPGISFAINLSHKWR